MSSFLRSKPSRGTSQCPIERSAEMIYLVVLVSFLVNFWGDSDGSAECRAKGKCRKGGLVAL